MLQAAQTTALAAVPSEAPDLSRPTASEEESALPAAPGKAAKKRRRRRGKKAKLIAPADGVPATGVPVASLTLDTSNTMDASAAPAASTTPVASIAPVAKAKRVPPPKKPEPLKTPTRAMDASSLVPTRLGFIRMRGKTDNGRRWYQEIEPELAITLVRERAAVVVNRQTIRRLYSNKEFRRYILTRDNYICHFCGQYGDTIDHMLPRAKGGHTTPDNCVCACNECNQSKADRDLEEFMNAQD